MKENAFFIDSCIWLNLFKKEKAYSEVAKKFLLKFDNIIFSNLVLRELQYVLNNQELFLEKKSFMEKEFTVVKVTQEDYIFARKIESELQFALSFYDCIHIATTYRLRGALITRDNDLIRLGKKYVPVCKPEELL
jgi:predicted nucleic acid-binding protein